LAHSTKRRRRRRRRRFTRAGDITGIIAAHHFRSASF